MALLNEKQIAELVKMASVTSTATSYHDDLCEWNAKQQAEQFEPDWSTAPDYTVMAAINISWLTESGSWTLGYRLATYDRPPVTPHPHAEIMAKYAEVAARRVDPWVEFEFKHKTYENWVSFEGNPNYDVNYDFRHIGDNK